MKVKELQKTVNIAWSPMSLNPIYLATGTAAQQLDSGATSTIEIYSMNFIDPGYDLKLRCSFPSRFRYHKLIWSPSGHGNGLIVGGCESGHVMIYSAEKLLAGEEGLLALEDKHSGSVTGLEFNPFQQNLLVSAASESEILIWDLNNTSTHMNPGTRTQPLEDVQNVAWNRQVQHILASVFSTRCVIWDLRKSEQIIKLSDTQSQVRWHSIQWHPEIATQVWLASENDQVPVVQLWDLRYATVPAKSLHIHKRGVLGMSWCPQDSNLMVSCGKDNHIYCWDPNTDISEGDILSDVAATPILYSDVQWCPRNPALIASSSLDGNVSIYSLFGGTQQEVQTTKQIADSFPGMEELEQIPLSRKSVNTIYKDLRRAPKWIKRRCGVCLSFGGKLLHYSSSSNHVTISQVITERKLVERARVLEGSLHNSNFTEYCLQRIDKVSDENGRYLWDFIKANFSQNPREELLNLLGYHQNDTKNKLANYTQEETQILNDVDRIANETPSLINQCDVDTSPSNFIKEPKKFEFQIPTGEHPDGLITEALLTGNIDAAVELCMKLKRTTEALIIASTAGVEYLSSIQKRYLQTQNNELCRVIEAFVSRDWMSFSSYCTVDSWKEALVAALNQGDHKFVDICEKLGDRLLESNCNIENIRNAILCYICAGSIDKLITAWYKLKKSEEQTDLHYTLNTTDLQELAEILVLICKSQEFQGISLHFQAQFENFIREYISLLASQGALNEASAYICALNNCNNSAVVDLYERVFRAVNLQSTVIPKQHEKIMSKSQSLGGAKQFPFYSTPAAVNRNENDFQSSLLQKATEIKHPNMLAFNQTAVLPIQTSNSIAAPSINDQIHSPAMRPPSANSAQSAGLNVRSKYILDPSVATSGNTTSLGGASGGLYNPVAQYYAPMAMPPVSQSPQPPVNQFPSYQSTFNEAPSAQQPLGPKSNYLPEKPAQPEYQQPQFQAVQRNSTPPPGWNDPPVLKSRMNAGKSGIHPPLLTSLPDGILNPNQQCSDISAGGFMRPTMSHNTNLQFSNQNMSTQACSLQHEPNLANKEQLEANSEITEVNMNKAQLPEEYKYMQTVLEELKSRCLAVAIDSRTKRKFVDVNRRLENLYDCLRNDRLASVTITALNQLVNLMQIGDYENAMQTYTSIAFGSDFSQCAGFMPGLKVLIQSAAGLQVHLK